MACLAFRYHDKDIRKALNNLRNVKMSESLNGEVEGAAIAETAIVFQRISRFHLVKKKVLEDLPPVSITQDTPTFIRSHISQKNLSQIEHPHKPHLPPHPIQNLSTNSAKTIQKAKSRCSIQSGGNEEIGDFFINESNIRAKTGPKISDTSSFSILSEKGTVQIGK
ncbi:hypothetical protein CEXT_506341 [Caerostris extrusa]|uniref:Uncharacterized protein n=1 Tax=Caerostris extrusa TaxID=172846 RepID=A0AAV4W1J1_CAEEX|nr:hypothetical protein CEXT_506341 [Caerostris extrusa]